MAATGRWAFLDWTRNNVIDTLDGWSEPDRRYGNGTDVRTQMSGLRRILPMAWRTKTIDAKEHHNPSKAIAHTQTHVMRFKAEQLSAARAGNHAMNIASVAMHAPLTDLMDSMDQMCAALKQHGQKRACSSTSRFSWCSSSNRCSSSSVPD